jgi:hypothetical protein
LSAEARARPGELSLECHSSARLGPMALPHAPRLLISELAGVRAPPPLRSSSISRPLFCRSSGARATPLGGAAGERQGACVRLAPNARLGATWAAFASKHMPRRALGARRGEQGPPQPRQPRSRFVMARGRDKDTGWGALAGERRGRVVASKGPAAVRKAPRAYRSEWKGEIMRCSHERRITRLVRSDVLE